MAEQLPSPATLREAVESVIEQNTRIGYRPTRFIGAVSSVGDTELVRVCTDLISSPTALEALEKAVVKYPDLLTLEDLIFGSIYGSQWGFEQSALDQAKASVRWFDRCVRRKRWSTQDVPS